MNKCINCGALFTGFAGMIECGDCRLIKSNQRSAQKAQEQAERLQREQAQQAEQFRQEMMQNERRAQEQAAESEYRIESMFKEQTERLIVEQQKTQRLLQEQHVTPQMAYTDGYNLFHNRKGNVTLDLDHMVYTFDFDTEMYVSRVLQQEFIRGYLTRLNEVFDFLRSETKQSCYTAGSKGWNGFILSNLKIDYCTAKAEWNCELDSFTNSEGYIKYFIRNENKLNSVYVDAFKEGLAKWEESQNLPELKKYRVTERAEKENQRRLQEERAEAERISNEDRIKSEREWLAKRRIEKRRTEKIQFIAAITCVALAGCAGLYFFHHLLLAFDPAILVSILISIFIGVAMFNTGGVVALLVIPLIVYFPIWVFTKALFLP